MPPLVSTVEATIVVAASSFVPPKSGTSTMTIQPQRGKSINPSNLTSFQKESLRRLNSLPFNTGPRRNLANHLSLGKAPDGLTTIKKARVQGY